MQVQDSSFMNTSILVFSVIGLALILIVAKARMGKKDDEGFRKVTASKNTPFLFKRFKEDDDVISTKDDFERI